MTVANEAAVIKNFINGKWVSAAGSEMQDVINPATGKKIASVPISTGEDVHAAAMAAAEAFKTWKRVPVPKRARILLPIITYCPKTMRSLRN